MVRKIFVAARFRRRQVYKQKKRGTLSYAHSYTLGSLQNLTPKKNDKAHAEYVYDTKYTMAHYQLTPIAKTMMHGGILHIP